jgi:phospholipid-binding lipoprotein MlaA
MYLVLPVFGPSSLRDGVGRVGDYFLDPLPYAIEGSGELIAVKAYDRVNDLSLDDDTYEKIKEDALDPYLFIRDAYMQRRQALIRK